MWRCIEKMNSVGMLRFEWAYGATFATKLFDQLAFIKAKIKKIEFKDQSRVLCKMFFTSTIVFKGFLCIV